MDLCHADYNFIVMEKITLNEKNGNSFVIIQGGHSSFMTP